jgi:hypothetical protein
MSAVNGDHCREVPSPDPLSMTYSTGQLARAASRLAVGMPTVVLSEMCKDPQVRASIRSLSDRFNRQ